MGEIKYLENERTIFNLGNKDVNLKMHTFGFLVYFVLFVVFIPYLLVKGNHFELLAGYFPNLDLIATVIAYHGGPLNTFLWQHLYNPADSTISGYISSNIINLFALLGVTYIIAYYSYTKKSIYKGWSRAFIMLPMTYFIPSNIIVYYMNKIGLSLNNFFTSGTLIHYLLVLIVGFIILICFIISESILIEKLSPLIIKLLNLIY